MDSQEDLVYAVCSGLSIIGSIFIIATGILLRFKTQLLKVLVWISVSDLILCLPYWLLPPTFATCIITSFLEEFGIVSSFIWTSSVAFVYQKTIRNRDEMIGEKNYLKVIIFAMTMSILLGSVSLADKFFDENTNLGQCENPTKINQINMKFWIHMGIPFYTSFLYITACYIYTMVKLRRLLKRKGIYTKKPLGLLIYPICLLICWGPLIFPCTLAQFNAFSLSPNALIWTKVFVRLQGILNAICYGFSRQTKDDLKDLCLGGSKHSKSTNPTFFSTLPLLDDTSMRLDYQESTLHHAVSSNERQDTSRPEKFVVCRNG